MISSHQSPVTSHQSETDLPKVVAKDSDKGKGGGDPNPPLDDQDKRLNRPGRGKDSRKDTNHKPD